MKKSNYSAVAALWAACSLGLPLAAAAPQGDVDGGAAVSVSQAGGTTSASTDRVENQAKASAMVNDMTDGKGNPKAHGAPASTAASRSEKGLRSEYKGYSRRLDNVEKGIEKAQQKGRYTAEEARKQREDIAGIRAKFKKRSDKTAPKLSQADKDDLDTQVKNNEDALAEANKK